VFAYESACSQADAQLQDAVTTAHETSTAFSEEVIKENVIFELSKDQEMKELLQTYADGQVEMLQRVSAAIG
jgi:sorting nexin-4